MTDLKNMKLSIACADVGSVAKGNFGWAICDPPARRREVKNHGSIEAFAAQVVARFRSGRSVALGFECPLFVPFRTDPLLLTTARKGDGNRPWSAGAGCGSLVTGIVEAAWVLDRIRRELDKEPPVFFGWREFLETPGSLFLWEAFVSRHAKSGTHHGDAGLAVAAFAEALDDPGGANLVSESRVLSLVGAVLLRTGWAVPTSMLSSPCLVVAA